MSETNHIILELINRKEFSNLYIQQQQQQQQQQIIIIIILQKHTKTTEVS